MKYKAYLHFYGKWQWPLSMRFIASSFFISYGFLFSYALIAKVEKEKEYGGFIVSYLALKSSCGCFVYEHFLYLFDFLNNSDNKITKAIFKCMVFCKLNGFTNVCEKSEENFSEIKFMCLWEWPIHAKFSFYIQHKPEFLF